MNATLIPKIELYVATQKYNIAKAENALIEAHEHYLTSLKILKASLEIVGQN